MTCSVGPLSSGECPTQWYNATLSLQYLTELADVVVYRENDANLSHCIKAAAHPTSSQPSQVRPLVALNQELCSILMCDTGYVCQVTMASINESLAADLASVLFPCSGMFHLLTTLRVALSCSLSFLLSYYLQARRFALSSGRLMPRPSHGVVPLLAMPNSSTCAPRGPSPRMVGHWAPARPGPAPLSPNGAAS